MAPAAVDRKRLVPWINYLIFFCVVNETVFNVSTPRISEQFGLTPAGVSWMMTSFMVFFGVGSLIYGKLSDIYSPKGLIFIGTVLYNFGSLLGFLLRDSYGWVLLARAVQGMGASAIPALVFVVVARYFHPDERGRVFGGITSTVSFAIGVGPVLGGFVSGSLHWSYLFLVPFFTLVSLPFFNRELPWEERREGGLDILGAVLVACTVGTLVVFLNFNRGTYLILFLAALSLSLGRMFTARSPFIPPDLFRNVRFRNGVVVGLVLFSIVMGIFFLIPLMLHQVHGLGTARIGLILFPGAISSVFFGPYAGRLADRRGNPFVVAIGLTLVIASMGLMALFLGFSPTVIAGSLLLTNVGFAFFQTALINSVSRTLGPQETGIGMGVFNLVAIISGALGTALVGKVLDGGWLDHPFLPTLSRGHAYGNLMLIFALISIGGWIFYQFSYGEQKGTPSGNGASLDPSGD
ncbi:MAG TPA: MFS transporter [bacterium]|nr:MFS transporter [bacterium]